MKKRIVIIISIVLVLILLLILMFVGVVPNIFIDTSSLTCNRIYVEAENFRQDDKVIINFDKRAIVKDGTVEHKFVYENTELAEHSYNETKQNMLCEDNCSIVLDNEIVIVTVPLELSLDQITMKKKEIIKVYEEYGYECK